MRTVLLVTLLALAPLSAAADSDVARRVEGQVWSPYCPGVLLSDCGTSQARELRQEIEARAEDGDSVDEILDWVRDEYGAQAIARPPASGAGLVVWLVPPAIFLAGGALVWRTVSKNTDRRLVHGDQER